MDVDERDCWRELIGAAKSYPGGTFMPPLRAPHREDRARMLGALAWEYDRPEVLTARAVAVTLAAGSELGRLVLTDDDDANATAFLNLLLLPACKGRMLAAWGAADAGFFTFLRQFARPLVRLGCTIEPIATGSRCKALIIRKGRRSWWLTDAGEMVGAASVTEAQLAQEYAPRTPAPVGSAERLAAALGGFQRSLLGCFGVSIRATIGAAALRAATRFVPADRWVWRPPPLLVAMCRTGHAMRGGYVYAERYDGPAFRLDVNKAYTGALAGELPLRMALTSAHGGHEGQLGVFLCRVRGPGRLPVYLGVWQGKGEGFKLDYWQGRHALAVLTSTEITGIIALGYQVQQLGGYAAIRTWTLQSFAQQVAAVCVKHGRGSAHERTAKVIGNAVYGKLAERPEREQVMYAEQRPGPEWRPMLDEHGEHVPDLWTAREIAHRPGQHVDVAATITGRVRGQVYEAAALVLALGGDVVHADTDGLLATVNPGAYLAQHAHQPGTWRVEDEPQRAIVWGRKGYAFGDQVKAAGFAGLTAADAERLVRGGDVETTYMPTPAPWRIGAGVGEAKRTARATA